MRRKFSTPDFNLMKAGVTFDPESAYDFSPQLESKDADFEDIILRGDQTIKPQTKTMNWQAKNWMHPSIRRKGLNKNKPAEVFGLISDLPSFQNKTYQIASNANLEAPEGMENTRFMSYSDAREYMKTPSLGQKRELADSGSCRLLNIDHHPQKDTNMINFDALKITPGTALQADKWNDLVDGLKLEVAPNLDDTELRLNNASKLMNFHISAGTIQSTKAALSIEVKSESGTVDKRLLTVFETGIHLGTELRINTNYGYLRMGALNSSYAHFYTDRSKFYFQKELMVDSGKIGSYNENLSLCTQGTARVTISKSNGNVGIKTTNPGALLSLGSSLAITKLAMYQNAAGDYTYGMGVTSGKFRFNLGNPQARYAFHDQGGSSANEIFTIEGDGDFKGRNFTKISDARVKKDVTNFTDGLATIERLRPVSFALNGLGGTSDGKQEIGLIAQEVAEVAPYMSAIHEGKLNPTDTEDTKMLSIQPMTITYVLINAVQELSKEVKALKRKIQKLTS